MNSFTQRVAALLPTTLRHWGVGHIFVIVAVIAAGVILHLAVEKP